MTSLLGRRLVLNAATVAGHLLDLGGLPLQRRVHGGFQVVGGRLVLVVVHGAEVDDLPLLVQDEELGRDGGAEVAADLLAGVEQVGEVVALLLGALDHLLERVGAVALAGVVAVDGDDADALGGVLLGEVDDAVLVRLGDRAVVAGDDDDDNVLVLELVEGVLLVIDALEVLEGRGGVAGLDLLVEVTDLLVGRGVGGVAEAHQGQPGGERQDGGSGTEHALLLVVRNQQTAEARASDGVGAALGPRGRPAGAGAGGEGPCGGSDGVVPCTAGWKPTRSIVGAAKRGCQADSRFAPAARETGIRLAHPRGWNWRWMARRRSRSTWVYCCVVRMLAWPRSSCTVRRSAPPASRWVAKLCRNVCGLTRALRPARRTYFFTSAQTISRVRARPPRLTRTHGASVFACTSRGRSSSR